MRICRRYGRRWRRKYLDQILAIATIPPAVNQIELHPYVLKISLPLLEYHKERGIVTTSYGGLSSIARFPGGPVDPVLARIAARLSDTYGKPVTQAQVLQVWLRKKGLPYVTTTSKAERMMEYLQSSELPDITDEEEHSIDAAGSQVHHRFNICPWMDDVE
ncbi:hypothetical protein NM688_g2018 [Phlebia brevispora]|uniref:Uncharacterized protein n=1 Tax=Phlebia brevispora TaxID=194682 RepID=A0ACC1TA26_9APHY|nr:hypothetical protein NM688_g2018 [Phlebia brevispora]